jgi:hypothetical protein
MLHFHLTFRYIEVENDILANACAFHQFLPRLVHVVCYRYFICLLYCMKFFLSSDFLSYPHFLLLAPYPTIKAAKV